MKRKTLLALAMAAAGAHAQVTFEMVQVPGGCFKMGSETGEKHERPVHEACVRNFEIGKTEVTQAQWRAVMGVNPSSFGSDSSNPVEMVSWNEVQEFIRRVNESQKGAYRLPTEAEWEYACRSGGRDEEYAGGDVSHVQELAWFNKDEAGNTTHPVGTKKPNGLGIHDMSGNVWEWVQDEFTSPYGSGHTETKRVVRGGSWNGKINYVRCAIRNRYEPDRRDSRIGLRLARDIP